MAESDKVFAGSIPKFYDALMVPLIFEAYAANMAEIAAACSPGAVIETAAGSGAVTRALAPRLKHDARYVVTDLNQPMLDYAAVRQGFDTRIEWRQADALDLPFEDASFDVVCCQFGAMFFPDRVAGYAEARRVLRRGGWFVFNVWDRIEENAFAYDVTNALAVVFPHDPPQFLARTPHGYHDVAHIRDELRHAGFFRLGLRCMAALRGGLCRRRRGGRLMVQRVLEHQGFQVTAFSDPSELLRTVQAQPGSFDSLVTDYKMPVMNDLEVARAVRAHRPDTLSPLPPAMHLTSCRGKEGGGGPGLRELPVGSGQFHNPRIHHCF